jgi:hypothetical protein
MLPETVNPTLTPVALAFALVIVAEPPLIIVSSPLPPVIPIAVDWAVVLESL